MTKVRMLLASVLALLAVGAVASASASAAACAAQTGSVCQSVAGELTLEAKYLVLAQTASSKLKVEGIGTVLCTKIQGAYTGDEVEKSAGLVLKLVLKFSVCSLEGHAACKVTEPIETVSIKGEIPAFTGTTGKVTFAPEAGTEFAKVTISGCEQEAIIKVTGTQGAALPTVTTEAVEHEVNAAATESNLKDGAKLATFETSAKTELESLKAWALKPNEF
jgi:hypothetical protein